MGKKKKTPRKCSTCLQPVAGHVGKVGEKCPNAYVPPSGEFEKKAEEAKKRREDEEKKKEEDEKRDGGGGKEEGGNESSESSESSSEEESEVEEVDPQEYLKKRRRDQKTKGEKEIDLKGAVLNLTKQMMTLTQQVAYMQERQDKYESDPARGRFDSPERGRIATQEGPPSNGHIRCNNTAMDADPRHTRESTVPLYQLSSRIGPVPGLRRIPEDLDTRLLCTVPGVPERTIKMALNGEFIFLEHFLGFVGPETDGCFELVTDAEGNVEARQKRPKKQINNIATWLEAWQTYESLMVNFHGIGVYNKMSPYRIKVIEWDRAYVWGAVQSLDSKHRHKLNGKSVDFMDIDPVLITSNLNHASAKPRRTENKDKNGPFRGQPTSSGRRYTSLDKYDNYTYICHQWNDNRCGFTNCKKWHICKGCGGEMPFIECEKSGKCARAGQSYSRN